MPTTEDGKKTGAAARAEAADDNSFVSKDTFSNPALQTLTATATAEDPQGIERIVIGSTQAFTPAPLEATDEQKANMDQLNKQLAEAKQTRLEALKPGEDPKDEDRVANEPGNAGSQTGATSGTNRTGTESAKGSDSDKSETKSDKEKS